MVHMSLAKKILGKELELLGREDLEVFFAQPREETSILEFKSGEVKVNSIFKEICAFLNTEGGLIIVGSPKEQKVGKMNKRICKGKLVPSSFRDKEWLYSLVVSNIVPEPHDLKIHEIKDQDDRFFVIEVGQSQHPPHQFLTDGRYYIRVNQEARPAPHGIVEALFFKFRKPQLQALLNIEQSEKGVESRNEIYITFRNQSQVPAGELSYFIQFLNIEEVHSNSEPHSIKQSSSDNFEIEGNIAKVLIGERVYPLNFHIVNRDEPFVVSVMVWNHTAGLYTLNTLFDPVNFKYMEQYCTGDEGQKSAVQLYKEARFYRDNLE